jgi:hypothetical protein
MKLIPDEISIGRIGLTVIMLFFAALTFALGLAVGIIQTKVEEINPLQVERTYITIDKSYGAEFYVAEGAYEITSHKEPITK